MLPALLRASRKSASDRASPCSNTPWGQAVLVKQQMQRDLLSCSSIASDVLEKW